jgi:sugar transferase EpsL
VRHGTYPGKRWLDIALVVPALVVLAPVIAVISLLVRLKLGSPVLFRQERPGLGGAPFKIVKFRTMTDARDSHGELLPDAQRITAFGRLLRRASLDELPELFNVLRGDMSLVGPRPLLMRYLDRYTPEQMRRHDVAPGVTGLVQVSGRNSLSWEEKFAMDVWYVDHASLWLDLKVLAMTVVAVVGGKGVSAPSYVSSPEFMGSALKRRDVAAPAGHDLLRESRG